jgi:hypothetical protein
MAKRLTRVNSSGYVTVEYAIVTAAGILALITPIPGMDASMIEIVIFAIKSFQAHTTSMLALP